MLRVIFNLFVFCLAFTASLAHSASPSTTKPIKRVIFITLDGVRWQDVFLDHNRMPIFWSKYAKAATIYGDPQSNITMEVASIPVSLPSYQSQMSGAVQSCKNNECGRLQAETFPEKLVKKLGLKRKDVASISCWEVMDNAVEHVPGTIFSNHGTRPMHDPDSMEDDPTVISLNKQQAAAYPGDDTRTDKYTLAQAIHYLEKYKPVFLWISLGETDDAAHEAHLESYHHAIAFGDQAIDTVMQTLRQLNLDKETMVIITTDHGRGDGKKWSEHDENYPEAKQTWAFVINGKLLGGVQDGNMEHYSTLSIRPTVEAAFGIKS